MVPRIAARLDRIDDPPASAEFHRPDIDLIGFRLLDSAVASFDQQAFDTTPAEITGKGQPNRAAANDQDRNRLLGLRNHGGTLRVLRAPSIWSDRGSQLRLHGAGDLRNLDAARLNRLAGVGGAVDAVLRVAVVEAAGEPLAVRQSVATNGIPERALDGFEVAERDKERGQARVRVSAVGADASSMLSPEFAERSSRKNAIANQPE